MTRHLALALALATPLAAFAQQPAKPAQPAAPAAAAPAKPAAPPAAPVEHSMVTPAELKWGEGPPTLVAGAKMAVLYGNPGATGLFIVRLKMPAGYKVAAHWHPTDEMVTVMSGTFQMGMGDKLDAKTVKALPAGSMATMPAKTNHFAIAKGETVVQITAMGPFEINYVNPDDDPRKGKTAEAAPAKK